MQAECLAAAYRLWRRNWKGQGKEYTAGALVWQVSVAYVSRSSVLSEETRSALD